MGWLFTSHGQSIGASASASVLPMNIQDWFPVELTGLSSLLSNGLSRVFSSTTVWKYQFFSPQASLWSNSHMTTGKTIALNIQTFIGKVTTLPFNMLSRFVIVFFQVNLFSSVQFSRSVMSDPLDHMDCSMPVHHELLEFTQTHLHWVGDASNHLILCSPLLLLPTIFLSIRVSSNESVLPIR